MAYLVYWIQEEGGEKIPLHEEKCEKKTHFLFDFWMWEKKIPL